MNPHQKPQEDVVVTQEDRAIAWPFAPRSVQCDPNPGSYARWMNGRHDSCEIIQAFARHRLLGHEAGRRDMREAAGKVAEEDSRRYADPEVSGSVFHLAQTIRALPTEPLGGEKPE